MKMRLFCVMAFMGVMPAYVMAQKATDAFVKIEEHNMFSQCFVPCDTNGDGIVTYGEATAATMLSLEKGGRMNIIEDYSFLKYFPNLVALSVGNTTLEVIDMHYLKKLRIVNVTNALWLKKIIVGGDFAPEITGENVEDPNRESVKVEFWVEDSVARELLHSGYDYVEPIKQDGQTFYVVGKSAIDGPYGLWHNGKLEVPCEYSLEAIKENYFTVQVQEAPVGIDFKDEGVRDFCLRNKHVDVDKDGNISLDEAAAVTKLSLMNFRSFIRNIKSYEDLLYFPNLEYFHAGFSYAETVDVSCCPKLKELDLSDCRMLKRIVLAKGCKPEIKYPVAYKGEQAKIEYKKQ